MGLSGSQLVDCLRRIRKCGLVTGGASLGVVSEGFKVYARPSLTAPARSGTTSLGGACPG